MFDLVPQSFLQEVFIPKRQASFSGPGVGAGWHKTLGDLAGSNGYVLGGRGEAGRAALYCISCIILCNKLPLNSAP